MRWAILNDEERAKYICPKDKENLEKKTKEGGSFGHLTLYGKSQIYMFVAIFTIELVVLFAVIYGSEWDTNVVLIHQKNLLVKQVDDYIKHDYKNMNCVEKNVFLEKYMTDKTIYGHQEMQDWLQENFNDNCNPNKP